MLYIAYIQEDGIQREKPKLRKPSRRERIEALADHLMDKWRKQDRLMAIEKFKNKKRLQSTSANHSDV